MNPPDALDPYAPPLADVDVQVARVAVLAGPGVRLVAYLIDTAIAVALLFAGIFLAAIIGGKSFKIKSLEDFESLTPDTAIALVAPLAVLAVVQLVLLHFRGATLGKLPFGLRILKRDGRRAGLWRTVLMRWVVLTIVAAILNEYTFVLGSVLTMLVDPLMIFSREHRTLHDRIAGTIVVRTR